MERKFDAAKVLVKVAVKVAVTEALEKEFPEAQISFHEVEKNNGLVLYAVRVRPEGSNIAPTIYLDSYCSMYEKGNASLDEVVSEVVDAARNAIENTHDFGDIFGEFMEFAFAKTRIIMALVNTKRNENLLEQLPHREVEDLSIIYKVLAVSGSETGTGTITVRNEHAEVWGVTEEELYKAAVANTEKLLPPEILGLAETAREANIKRGMPAEEFPDVPPELDQYIVTNSEKQFGAVNMLNSNVLLEVCKKVRGDIYILPSSIHEIICVNASLVPPKDLLQMVLNVNETEVADDEILSDSVYRFNAETGSLSLVASASAA